MMMKNAEKKLLLMLLLKAFIATMVYLYYDHVLTVGTTFKSSVLATKDPSYSQDSLSRDHGLANDQWATVCSNVRPPYSNVTSQSWSQVASNINNTFIYSAYFTKVGSGHHVVIVGIQSDRTKYVCQVWHWNNRTNNIEIREEVPIDTFVLPEGHGQRYTAHLYKCRLSSEHVPLYVSMVPSSCSTPTTLLSVKNNNVPETIRKFTICLSPLNYMYARAYEIVEWIELNRLLGADRIIVYNHSISDNVAKVLEYYSKRGITEVVNWQVPVGSDIHYFGQVVALNDCLYRNKNKSEFIVNLDLDEYIIPHSEQTNTWRELMATLDGNADAYLFRNTFFRKDWENRDSVAVDKQLVNKYKLVTLQKVEHESHFYPYRARSKYIARTSSVSQVMIHEVRLGRNARSVQTVPISHAFLHHYRSNDDGTTKPKEKVVDTTIPDKFGAELISHVQAVWTDLSNVPMDMQ